MPGRHRVDGAGWAGVYKILRKDGYAVRIVQNPTISLAGDVAATRLIVDGAESRVLLVGHSYGGAVITEAGNDPKVTGLVYICAFAPDKGRIGVLVDQEPGSRRPSTRRSCRHRTAICSSTVPSSRHHSPAAMNAETAAFMAESQVPWGVDALGGTISEPAWKTKPSWYQVTTGDRMIPPPVQRFMAKRAGSNVVEVAGSHAIYVSRPAVVAALIVNAAKGLETAAK